MVKESTEFEFRKDFSGGFDEHSVEEYSEELFARFLESPEAFALDDAEDDFDGFVWSEAFIRFGIEYHGVTPATMTRPELEDVLFGIFPRKMSVEASKAEEIVFELKAFWQFLQREFTIDNTAACLAALDDDAVVKLERKLADPSNFGMAKSFFTAGKAMGFDVETEEGLQAWVKESNAHPDRSVPVQPPQGLPPERPAERVHSDAAPSRRLREERKRKKKQARASRRKNR